MERVKRRKGEGREGKDGRKGEEKGKGKGKEGKREGELKGKEVVMVKGEEEKINK